MIEDKQISITKLNISLVFVLLLFIQCLENLSNNGTVQFVLKHVDEGITLLFIIYLIINGKQLFQAKSFILTIWLFFMIWGVLSSIYSREQSIIPSLVDAIAIVERFMVGYFTLVIFQKKNKIEIGRQLYSCARVISVILFILCINEIFLFPIWPKGEYRYFMNSMSLMFPHVTYLAAASAIILILLGTCSCSWSNLVCMVMITFVGMCTLRSKAIGFFLIYWVLYVIIFILKYKKYKSAMILGGFVGVIAAWGQIWHTFFNESTFSPRKVMLKDSFQLLLDRFPFGTGYGSFGSTIASSNYSGLYTKLGYEEYNGMNPENTSFLTDSFWPEILGQFGFVGTVLFIVVVIYFLKLSFEKMKISINTGFAMLMTMIYLIIASVAESSFFNPTSFLFFIMFAIYEYGDGECL